MEEIEGFQKEYAITKGGRVWSHKSSKYLSLRGSGYSGSIKRHKREYKTVALWKSGEGYRYFYVHRLVAQTFIPNPNRFKTVNHIDGDKSNNNVENLEWCTHSQNIEHAFVNGFTTRGNKNSQTKLTEEQVRSIRNEYDPKTNSYSLLANKYGVCPATIGLVIRRENWKWLN